MRPIAVLGLLLSGLIANPPQGPKGEVNTPPAKGERKETKLRVGDPAPDFDLVDPKKTRAVKLSSFRNKKPVVLIFGSYT